MSDGEGDEFVAASVPQSTAPRCDTRLRTVRHVVNAMGSQHCMLYRDLWACRTCGLVKTIIQECSQEAAAERFPDAITL